VVQAEFADIGYVMVSGNFAIAGSGDELLENPDVGRLFLGGLSPRPRLDPHKAGNYRQSNRTISLKLDNFGKTCRIDWILSRY